MGKHVAVSEFSRLVALAGSVWPTPEDHVRAVAERLRVSGIDSVSGTFLSARGLYLRGAR
jgi:hypothetical protein